MKNKKMVARFGIGVITLSIVSIAVAGYLLNQGTLRLAWLDSLMLANKSRFEMREAKAHDLNRTLKIGIAGPIETMKSDTLFLQGVEMALKEINEKGGFLGMTVQGVIEDDQGSMTENLRIAQKFAVDPNCIAVIGHWSSAFTLPLVQIYDATGVLLISPTATSQEITQSGHRTVVSTIPNDLDIGQKMVSYAKQQGYKKIVVYYKDAVNGKSASKAFEQFAKASDLEILDRHAAFANKNEFESTYKAWQMKGIDAVYIADTMRSSKEFISWLRAKDKSLPILAGEGFNFNTLEAVLGKNAENIVFASFASNQPIQEETVNFKSRFLKQYGVEPDDYAYKGYESVEIIKQAVESAKSTSPTAIMKYIKSGKTFKSVNGPLQFNEMGETPYQSVLIKKVINGKGITVAP